MSLSKLGLPGSRCGIVIADEKVISAITNMNGIISLSPGGMGPAIAAEMIERGDLLRLSNEVIRRFTLNVYSRPSPSCANTCPLNAA